VVIRETGVRNERLRGGGGCNGCYLSVRNILQNRALRWCEHTEKLMEENHRKICCAGCHKWKGFPIYRWNTRVMSSALWVFDVEAGRVDYGGN
jgi:hypothetical protein